MSMVVGGYEIHKDNSNYEGRDGDHQNECETEEKPFGVVIRVCRRVDFGPVTTIIYALLQV